VTAAGLDVTADPTPPMDLFIEVESSLSPPSLTHTHSNFHISNQSFSFPFLSDACHQVRVLEDYGEIYTANGLSLSLSLSSHISPFFVPLSFSFLPLLHLVSL
jgi:hypothetical protein